MIKLMDIDELEDLAFRGAPVPDLNSLAQINLFQAFRNLYRFAASSGLTQEQGRKEKQEILDAYRVSLFWEQLYENTGDLWARIEKAATAYQKTPSIQTADDLIEAIYQTKRKVDENGK